MLDHGETALAWIKVLKDRDYHGAAALVESMDQAEMIMVITHLAALVADEWEHDCERLGVDFDHFMREAAMALAEKAGER